MTHLLHAPVALLGLDASYLIPVAVFAVVFAAGFALWRVAVGRKTPGTRPPAHDPTAGDGDDHVPGVGRDGSPLGDTVEHPPMPRPHTYQPLRSTGSR